MGLDASSEATELVVPEEEETQPDNKEIRKSAVKSNRENRCFAFIIITYSLLAHLSGDRVVFAWDWKSLPNAKAH